MYFYPLYTSNVHETFATIIFLLALIAPKYSFLRTTHNQHHPASLLLLLLPSTIFSLPLKYERYYKNRVCSTISNPSNKAIIFPFALTIGNPLQLLLQATLVVTWQPSSFSQIFSNLQGRYLLSGIPKG